MANMTDLWVLLDNKNEKCIYNNIINCSAMWNDNVLYY